MIRATQDPGSTAMPLLLSISVARRSCFPSLCTVALAFILLLPTPAVTASHVRGDQASQTIPLEPFGYQAISSRYLLEGATMLTLDYVDSQHLLVTFGIAKLMPRLADCPEDDNDRVVRAVLLEIPSGRELARTEWRFHDLGQYLWNTGGGHFLLRRRDILTVIAPLQNLASGQAFAEQPFLHFDRRIQAIVVSANRDLLSIETIKRTPPKPRELLSATPVSQSVSQPPSQSSPSNPAQPPAPGAGLKRRDPNQPKPDPTPVEVSFIRILRVPIPAAAAASASQASPTSPSAGAEPPPTRLVGRLEGRIYTSSAVNVPVTTEGFLRAKATTRDGVLLDFLTFNGKDLDLGDFATSCPPRPTFVSPSEFVAFGCRGSEQSLDLAGFNLRGDFLWQINFSDEQAYPGFASAVPAGRFAFSRTVTSTHVFGNETPSSDQLQSQEVRVIQTYNGKQLLRVVTSPIQRAGQNFTLSPDGLALAVIRDIPTSRSDVLTHHTGIEIYALPPLSDKDATQIKLEAAMAPAPSDSHFRFSPEEIKAALAAKPDTRASSEASQSTQHSSSAADAQIVGDQIGTDHIGTSTAQSPTLSSAVPATGTVPSSDPAPACATLTEAAPGPSAACPVASATKAAPASSEAAPQPEPEKRRKPPTLYEPAPPTPPGASPQ